MDNKNATLELGTKPVGKLLAQYAFPAIIAMIAASLYNILSALSFLTQSCDSLVQVTQQSPMPVVLWRLFWQEMSSPTCTLE